MKKFLLMCFSFGFAISVWAQDRVVTGKLTSKEDGSALPGVNVVLKGTTTGTVTDSDGAYKLSVPSSGGTLVFSFIGLESQEVGIGERSVVDVQLGSDVKQLSEVVVTGAGVATDKKKLGIAVESITSDKLPQTPSASIDQALIGKIAGAQISSISGNPGDPVQILLRGINTVQGGTLPMILVDGVEVRGTDINSLDLSNIDRVEVVQGAAAASLFGAQGAKGVIQIFTKRGKKGAVVINYNTSFAVNQYINVNNNLGKANLHPYLTDASNNLVDATGTPISYAPDGSLPGITYRNGGATRYAILNTANTNSVPYNANIKFYNHFNEVFQNGSTQNNTINISGAGDKSDYGISLNDNRTVSPVLKNGEVDRTNLTVNLGTELFKGFKLRTTTQAIYTKNTMVPGLGSSGGVGYGTGNVQGNVGAIYGFLNTSPFFDLNFKQADGTSPIYQIGGTYLSVNSNNPVYVKEYSTGMGNKIDIVQSFNANYLINKFVELDAKYGINYRSENDRWTFFNQSNNLNSNNWGDWQYYYNGNSNTGEVDYFTYTNTFQNFLASAFIRTDFKDDFHSSLPIETSTQISFDYRKNKYTEQISYATGIGTSPPYNELAGSSPGVGNDFVSPFITYGYLVNQKINYGNYGGVTGGFRSDWSSAFGSGSTPFTFPHADGFLLASTFWKDSKIEEILPYFKLRAAYGQAGIQPGPFDRYPVLTQNNVGTAAYSLATAPKNANLKVEVSTEFEAGTDLSINANQGGAWFSKINGSFTYWTRTSSNVIYNVPTAISTGAPNAFTNAIGMSSNGWQWSLNLPVYHASSFTWDFTTNWGHQVSKVTSIQGGADIVLTSAAGSTALVLHPGSIIGQIYGYKAITSLNNPELVAYNNAQGLSASNYSLVNGRVVLNSDQQIQFSATATPIGNPNPKFNSAFINTFGYKNFLTFSFQFDWINGSHLYNQTKEWMYRDGIHSDFTQRVTINGESGAFTAYHASAYYNLLGSTHGPGNNATKDFFWEDASFWRLRNVSLGFDVAKVANLKYFRKFQIVFTGRNLLTFTKYTGADPEVSSGQVNSAFDRGVDHSTIPNIKSYQVGLNVTF
jgi:TonB-dependent starch-binding outer membrane protein SusC